MAKELRGFKNTWKLRHYAQIGPFSGAIISNMFDIVALGDGNFKVIAQCEPGLNETVL